MPIPLPQTPARSCPLFSKLSHCRPAAARLPLPDGRRRCVSSGRALLHFAEENAVPRPLSSAQQRAARDHRGRTCRRPLAADAVRSGGGGVFFPFGRSLAPPRQRCSSAARCSDLHWAEQYAAPCAAGPPTLVSPPGAREASPRRDAPSPGLAAPAMSAAPPKWRWPTTARSAKQHGAPFRLRRSRK